MKEKVLNQRGLTLIALIITIIILVILAAVSINAIANMGIVGHAVNGSQKYASESVKENKILGDTVNVIDSTLGKLENIQNGNASGESSSGTTGNDEYTEDGLRKYILGADEKGRKLSSIFRSVNGTPTFIEDSENTESTVYQDVKFGYGLDSDNMDSENGIFFAYIRYGKGVYKITIDMSTTYTKELTKINSLSGHLGEYVTYGGIDYIVMAEDGGTVTLVSANALGTVTLGRNDEGAITAIPAEDENNPTTKEKGQRGAWSYNNAVKTLVTACKNATGLTVDGSTVISIRSVGNTNVTYTSTGISGSDSPGDYIYDYQTAGAESDWYTTNGYNNYHMKREETDYPPDLNTMIQLGIPRPDNGGAYWFATRRVNDSANSVLFYIYQMSGIGASLGYSFISQMKSNGDLDALDGENGTLSVRPVVTLNKSAIGW